MAQYLAGNEVKAELRASGVKVHQVAMSEIKHLAEGYVLKHPELIVKAKAICAELHQQELVKRERQRQRRIQKRLTQAQPKSSTTPMADNLAPAYSTNGR
jgi:hypothetical protein